MIFSFLHSPGISPLAWLHVAHVCHQWCELALNQSLLWSHIDFTNLTLAGAAEILARAKKAPLHLEARPSGDDARFSAFEKELQQHVVSHVCNLTKLSLSAGHLKDSLHLRMPFTVPAYIMLVPDTLFDDTTLRLSCLEFYNCTFSWRSPP
jgi:hypothetical protein